MTKHDLKELAAMGAELGAAKAEVDRLRGLLEEVHPYVSGCSSDLWQRCHAALSQQAGPAETTEAYTARDMATAAAQGFRDGQAAAEPAPAHDERTAFEAWVMQHNTAVREGYDDTDENAPEDICLDRQGGVYIWANAEAAWFAWKARSALDTRPAQTEQQPVSWQFYQDGKWWNGGDRIKDHRKNTEAAGIPVRDLYAAPIAQTAPQGKFRMGDLVKKSTGSEWEGRVVGWYSTEQTPEGYAVESSAHRNSVQIYPVTALEAVE